MRVTDEERREVVRKLRFQLGFMRIKDEQYAKDADPMKLGNAAYRNITWSVTELGNASKGNYISIVKRLADLIDRPTTTLIEDEDGRTCCANCGCAALYMSDAAYCPDCGAEVVSDED